LSKLGIVTVVTNEKGNLKNLYTSLSEQTFRDFTVYFVDNNSTDGSAEYFKELNSGGVLQVKYIKLGYNSGFSGGSNAGAEEALKDGCKYLFISNNDLLFDKSAIEELHRVIESDEIIACAGPLLMKHREKNPDIIQEFGGKINFKIGTVEKFYTNQNVNDAGLPGIMETDFVGGGVCFIKADVFKKIGMYETSYFAYFDEIDLSYRLKILNNYKMMVTSKAKIWHNHNWSRKNNQSYYFEYYLSERNKFLYYRKYKLYFSMILMFLEDSVKFPWRLIWFKKVCDFKLGIYYLKGMLDGILNKRGKPKLSFVK
jgi:GT2 family glycosyltransferase